MVITQEQIEQLHTGMLQRREELVGEIRHVRARAADHPTQASAGVPDTGDAAAADLFMDVDNAAVQRDIQELRDIETAEARIADGSYGSCIDCGLDIEYARLAVAPTATRCLPCQERYERTYAGTGTPSL